MRRLLTQGVVILAVLFSLGINSAAQNPTQESLESKKKRLSALEVSITQSRSKILEIDVQLTTLTELRAEIQKSIEEQKEESGRLLETIPIEEEALAFLDSPPRKVLAVSDSNTYLIDFDGAPRLVKLHGLYIDPLKSAAITKALKKRLVKKLVYFRCADVACHQGYLYLSRTGASFNAKLIQAGFAVPSDDAKFDVAAFLDGAKQWADTSSETESGGLRRR